VPKGRFSGGVVKKNDNAFFDWWMGRC